MYYFSVTFLLLLVSNTTPQRSRYDSPTYVAAVVEYSPVVDSTDKLNLGEVNAKNYLKIIHKAASYAIDIIVFPESSLAIPSKTNITFTRSHSASYIPDPVDSIIPCTDTSKHYEYSLKSMSCAAMDYQIYVLIDHREKVDCDPGDGCPIDGFLIYNTNVVFDRQGKVIARYRKYNLYKEIGVNHTRPIPTTFKTDFGVTFGTFICFDLIFAAPALNLTRDLGITDILFPTKWFDKSPFLFSTQVQAAWAYANDVNLLASGYNSPDAGCSGSGIYLGEQGYIDVISMKNKRSNVLLVAEVPKVINGKRTQNIVRSKVHVYEFTKEEIPTGETVGNQQQYPVDTYLLLFSTESIDVKYNNQKKTICDRGLCCDFKFTIDFDENSITNNSNYYRYRLAVLNQTYDITNLGPIGIKSCAVVSCTNDTKESCGSIFHNNQSTITPTTFTSLEISTSDIMKQDSFVFPLTYSQNMIPLNATDFTFSSVEFGKVSMNYMKLKKPINNLLSFTIFARNSVLDRIINSNSVI